MMELAQVFSNYATSMDEEMQLKEELYVSVQVLEKTASSATVILEKIHFVNGLQNAKEIVRECEELIKGLPEQFQALNEKIPDGDFYKYHNQFKNTIQKLVFIIVFVTYLKEHRLPSHDKVASVMGLKESRGGLPLDLEDYLMGCLMIGNELARMSVNSVAAGNYTKPFELKQFLGELHMAYSLLNPKQDLRRKFDELKYSVKKTEEVVYNLSLRGFKTKEHTSESC